MKTYRLVFISIALLLAISLFAFGAFYLKSNSGINKDKQEKRNASISSKGKKAESEGIVIYKSKKKYVLTPKDARFHPVLDAAMETIRSANGDRLRCLDDDLEIVKSKAKQGETIVILYGEPDTVFDDTYIFLDEQPTKPIGGRVGGFYHLEQGGGKLRKIVTDKSFDLLKDKINELF